MTDSSDFSASGIPAMSPAGISRALNDHMEPTPHLMKNLRAELALLDRSRRGRSLLDELDSEPDGIDASSLIELSEAMTRQLAAREPCPIFEQLIPRAAKDPDTATVLMVAMAPAVECIARLAHSHGPLAEDISSEVIADLWTTLTEAAAVPEGQRARFVISRTWSRTRTTSRRIARQESVVRRDLGTEVDEPSKDDSWSTARAHGLLDDLVGAKVITERDRELLVLRHLDGFNFDQIAELTGRSVVALRRQHSRIKAAVASSSQEVGS